jgi:hypothetical protein
MLTNAGRTKDYIVLWKPDASVVYLLQVALGKVTPQRGN